MSLLLVLPIVGPLAFAALGLLVRTGRWHAVVSLTGAAVHLGASLLLLARVYVQGTRVVQVGGWPAPFGITLVADLLAALMLAVSSLVGAAVFAYSVAAVEPRRKSFSYYPLLHVLMMGVSGSFLAGDLFNLYVWFEVMLIASFVLLSLGNEPAQLEGAVKYVTLNLVASALFLAGAGLLYGLMGTLNLADLAEKARVAPHPELLLLVGVVLLGAFCIKAGAFPLFFWLPAAYHTPPIAVSAVFAGLLTKVGVYALLRTFTLVFVQDVGFTHELLLVVSAFTMATGVLGAAAQMDLRRILSFHIVSQIGYMLMGLALFTPIGLAGCVFYVVHHILVKTNLFLIAGVVSRMEGTYDLKHLGGLYAAKPLLGALFLVPALALAGMPPLSGFFAKLVLLRAGLEEGRYLVVGTAAVVSLLTLYSMTKIWAEAFWKDRPPAKERQAPPPQGEGHLAWMVVPAVVLAGLTCILGLSAGKAMEVSTRVAQELLSHERYVDAVKAGAP